MLSESRLCPRLPARRLRRVSGVFRSSPSPAAGARLPALGLEPATLAPPPRPRLRARWVLTFPGERGLPSHSLCQRLNLQLQFIKLLVILPFNFQLSLHL